MIRKWLRALVKKVLSSEAIQRAPRPVRRGSVRLRLEVLEDRLTASVSELGPACSPVLVAVALSTTSIVSHGAQTPLPSPTAPAGGTGAAYGAPGWAGLLQDVIGSAAADQATAPSTSTFLASSASQPVTVLPTADITAESLSLPDAPPPGPGEAAQRPADVPFLPPPSADQAGSGVAQQLLPSPAARIADLLTVPPPSADQAGSRVQPLPAARTADLPSVPPPGADQAGSRVAQQPLPGPVARTADLPTVPSPSADQAGSGIAQQPLAEPAVPTGDLPSVPPPNADQARSGVASSPAAVGPERLGARVPDDALLQRYVTDGDQAAFGMLVRQYERVVHRTCQRGLGDPHLAQETVQATFMVLARKAAALDAGQPLTAWLCKVAFRAALRLRAALARRRRHEKRAARKAAVVAPLSADLETDEIFQALAEEMQRLPEKYRAPLVLCYLDGRTHGEAAHVIGLPRGSMANRIRDGLHRLRERLVARGFVDGSLQ